MHKQLKLTMLENRDIQIHLDDSLIHEIASNNRVLNGDDIYKIFSDHSGNEYMITLENTYDKDNDALLELKSLFDSIIEGISKLQTPDDVKDLHENTIVFPNEED